MNERRVVVVGGGAAGFFAAIRCAETRPNARVTVFEQSPEFLAKVRISGGGRCNVTHACFDPRELSRHYPRGGAALLGPFQAFQPRDAIAWFAARGVKLKTEPDGRMFPVSDSSRTIVDCLTHSARAAGVELIPNRGVQQVSRRSDGRLDLTLSNGEAVVCDRLMLATGGCRAPAAGRLAASLGHTLEPPVPSLFTFHLDVSWLRELAGIAIDPVEVSVPGLRLRERSALLITHSGLSGPAILRLSAWGARLLHAADYRFPVRINWLAGMDEQTLSRELQARRAAQPARLVANGSIAPLPARLWERLVLESGVAPNTRWAELSRAAQHQLVQTLSRMELAVSGKSLNRDEFVTCGGVRLSEVNFRTLESRVCPGLYFGGELLDIDGLTGGFNFQAAWTTGWIAGGAMGA